MRAGRQRSEALEQEASLLIPGGVNSNFRLGPVPPHRFWARGEGSRLTDVDGNEFVDYVLGMGTAILGHSPASLLARVARSSGGAPMPGGPATGGDRAGPEDQFPAAVAQSGRGSGVPGPKWCTLPFAWRAPPLSAPLWSSSKGTTTAGSTVSSRAQLRCRPKRATAAPLQSAGQSPGALADLVVLPWNNLSLLEGFVEERGSEVAAIIMEPVLCNTSVIVPHDGYLEGVRRLCDKFGIVLIFDEVITGFRVDVGGAQAMLGVTPDLTVLGKALGAGFPVAALGWQGPVHGHAG